MALGPFHDQDETRAPEAREAALLSRLTAQVAHAKARSKPYADMLRDVEPRDVTGRAGLARLPVLRKSELLARQRAEPPFAGAVIGDPVRVFQSPGPMYAPQPDRPDFARLARAMTAAGFRRGDTVHVGFTFHFTPGAWMVDSAARALGCTVFPGGTGNTEQQAQTIAEFKPRCYAGTPSFLKIILEKGRELGLDLSALRVALVSGEAFPPSLQKAIAGFGADAYQCYATADLGLIAYETGAREGLVVDEGVLVEIVRPGTGDPVPDGEVGEVVVTNFSPDYPLLRFGTGDLSAVMAGPSPCGRTNTRLKGWMGRADQTTKVKGMFVHPHQVAEVLKRHPEVKRGRLVVTQAGGLDVMTLRCESAGADAEALKATLQAVCKLKGEVELVPPDSLPNDGKVVEDARTYA